MDLWNLQVEGSVKEAQVSVLMYKRRMPRDIVAQSGEPVWGNGCELRGCKQSSVGVFQMCADGVAREFCEDHQ
jgi:hypothetical protein